MAWFYNTPAPPVVDQSEGAGRWSAVGRQPVDGAIYLKEGKIVCRSHSFVPLLGLPMGRSLLLRARRVNYPASKSPRVTQPYVQSRASTRVWPIMCVQTCALASMSIWRVSSRVSNLAYQIVCPYTYTCAQSCAQSCVASTLVCLNKCTLICVYVH